MQYQYVNDPQGNPLYVLVPIADFERLTAHDEQWENIITESDEFDNVSIPNEVVKSLHGAFIAVSHKLKQPKKQVSVKQRYLKLNAKIHAHKRKRVNNSPKSTIANPTN